MSGNRWRRPEEEPQAVQDHEERAAFVTEDGEWKRDGDDQRTRSSTASMTMLLPTAMSRMSAATRT